MTCFPMYYDTRILRILLTCILDVYRVRETRYGITTSTGLVSCAVVFIVEISITSVASPKLICGRKHCYQLGSLVF